MSLKSLASSSFALAVLWSASAWAEPPFLDANLDRIRAKGYEVQEVYQSLFGRYVIVAEAESGILEVVLDQHNGGILLERFTDRAYINREDTLGRDRRQASSSSGQGSSPPAAEGGDQGRPASPPPTQSNPRGDTAGDFASASPAPPSSNPGSDRAGEGVSASPAPPRDDPTEATE